MFIPQPPTRDEEGTVFCNLKGRNDTESDIIVGIKPGGDVTNTKSCTHSVNLDIFLQIRTGAGQSLVRTEARARILVAGTSARAQRASRAMIVRRVSARKPLELQAL